MIVQFCNHMLINETHFRIWVFISKTWYRMDLRSQAHELSMIRSQFDEINEPIYDWISLSWTQFLSSVPYWQGSLMICWLIWWILWPKSIDLGPKSNDLTVNSIDLKVDLILLASIFFISGLSSFKLHVTSLDSSMDGLCFSGRLHKFADESNCLSWLIWITTWLFVTSSDRLFCELSLICCWFNVF